MHDAMFICIFFFVANKHYKGKATKLEKNSRSLEDPGLSLNDTHTQTPREEGSALSASHMMDGELSCV